jgi:hypothetical protein
MLQRIFHQYLVQKELHRRILCINFNIYIRLEIKIKVPNNARNVNDGL